MFMTDSDDVPCYSCWEYKAEIKGLTDMLSRSLDIAFANSQYQDVENPMPSDIRDWWLKHKKWDKERK